MKIIKNYRYYVLMVLAALTIIGTFCVPDEELNMSAWMAALVIPRIAAAFTGVTFAKLLRTWNNNNAVPELSAFIRSE